MNTLTIHEVLIKGMHPYPSFTDRSVAEQVAMENSNATISQRDFIVFDTLDEFAAYKKGKQVDDVLAKLSDKERGILEAHFKGLYKQY